MSYSVKKFNNFREALEETTEKFGDRPAYYLKEKEGGEYYPLTYKQYKHDINSLGTALIDMGLKGKRIAVIGENRYEWAVTYLATVNGVGCIVPLDKSLPEYELESLLRRSEVSSIFFTDNNKEAIMNISKRINTIKHYVSMSEGDPDNNILDFKRVLLRGEALLKNSNTKYTGAEINNEEMSVLMFTSGTTDVAKGVMLSHKSICADIEGFQANTKMDENDVFLSILPLHHIFGSVAELLNAMFLGASIGYCEGLTKIAKNLQELKPTIFACVPGIVEMMYKQIWNGLEESGEKEQIQAILGKGDLTIEKSREIFKDIYAMLGGRLNMFIVAGAPVAPATLKGFRDFGIYAMAGYGLTEISGASVGNRIDNYKDEAIGLTFPNMETKIDNPNEEGIGEILQKSPSLMLGYYKNEEATKNAIKDGWLYTGDLGYMDDDGFIVVTGRKKNVIVLKNGKNVFPEEMEPTLGLNKYIKDCIIFERRTGKDDVINIEIGTSIVPNIEIIERELGKMEKEEILNILKKEVKTFNETLPDYKIITYVEIREEEFEKTPSGKIKRYI